MNEEVVPAYGLETEGEPLLRTKIPDSRFLIPASFVPSVAFC